MCMTSAYNSTAGDASLRRRRRTTLFRHLFRQGSFFFVKSRSCKEKRRREKVPSSSANLEAQYLQDQSQHTIRSGLDGRGRGKEGRKKEERAPTSFFPGPTSSSSETRIPPTVSTKARGASPMTFRYTSPTVLPFFTRTQSLKTAARSEPVPASPLPNVPIFLTGKTATRPNSSEARVRTWLTPVLPNRYSTISFRFSMRVLSFSSSSFKPEPAASGSSPSSSRSSRLSTNSEPGI